jgi:ankyrin repeat protein
MPKLAPVPPAAAAVAFPMWVVPIEHMIAIAESGETLPKHEDLLERGQLVKWEPGMKTIFFSHTWLSYTHPDPRRDKLKLILSILSGIQKGTFKVTGYWMATIIFKELGISAKKLKKDFSNAVIWMDYASIPQVDKTNQGLAISSITTYVALSDLFIVLAGPWEHVDDGSIRDVRAWGERGWCRMENLANSLSPVKKTFIVAQSATNVFAYGPSGIVGRYWFQETVGRGNFTVDADKLALGPTVLQLIRTRQEHALREGDLTFFRVLHAISNSLLYGLGTSVPEEPLEEWMATMRFEGVHDGAKEGLTPLRFAVIADRIDLVQQLLDAGADVEAPLRKTDNAFLALLPGETILHSATTFGQSAECLKLLLTRGANPRAIQRNPPFGSVLLEACTMSKIEMVEALHEANPDELWKTPHFFGILPFEECIMVGKPEMAQFALDHYPEMLGGLPADAARFLNKKAHGGGNGLRSAYTAAENAINRGAGLCLYAVTHIGDTRVLKAVLDKGHDPNGDLTGRWTPLKTQRKLPARVIFIHLFRVLSDRQKSPLGLMDKFVNGMDCSALHAAAFSGNLGAVNMLLEYGAKQTQMHIRKMTPLHCAALGGHESCIDALLRHAPEGANLAAVKDVTGRTPAQWAAKRGHTELASKLKSLEASAGKFAAL